jgi:hypothetical protein
LRSVGPYAACRCGADSFSGGTLPARTIVLVSAVLEQPGQTKTCTIVMASSREERDQFISLLQRGQVGGSSCSSDLLSRSTMALPLMLNAQTSVEPFSRPGQVHFHAVPRAARLGLLEPGQGLAWLASEQPIVLALAGIEDGHRHGEVPAGAASLLLLHGLSLLAGLVAVRWLTHVTRPLLLFWALHQAPGAVLVPKRRALSSLFRMRGNQPGQEAGKAGFPSAVLRRMTTRKRPPTEAASYSFASSLVLCLIRDVGP